MVYDKYTFRLLEVYTEVGIIKRKVLYSTKAPHDWDYCLREYQEAMNANKDDKVRIVLEIDDQSQPAVLAKRFKPKQISGNRMRLLRAKRISAQLQADAKRRRQNEELAALPYDEVHRFSCPHCNRHNLSEQGLHTHLRLAHEMDWYEVDKLERQEVKIGGD